MIWDDVIKECWKNFDEADRESPYEDREYVDETNHIYRMLSGDTYLDSADSAMFDVISDIFYQLKVKVKPPQKVKRRSISKKQNRVKPKFADFWNVKKGY